MIRAILLLIAVIIGGVSNVGCRSKVSSSPDGDVIIERTTDIQNIQIQQNHILPPYGTTVSAEKVTLLLKIYSSKDTSPERFDDIKKAIEHINSLASNDDHIYLEEVLVSQVGGSYQRVISDEYISENQLEYVNSSAVTMKLSQDMEENKTTFLQSVVEFNDFIDKIELPETIKTEVLAIGSELGDLEPYRQKIIAKIYEEISSIQHKYGETVKFEITGLYDNLKVVKLNDTQYYIYLEPIIVVSEF